MGQAGLEADVRHAEQLVQDWGRKDCEAIATPAVKKANAEVLMDSVNSLLLKEDRSHTMRMGYTAQDRQDLSYASTSLLWAMKAPRESDWESLKRVG
eukprot:9023771-Heterocapsa_arctica.AAC.1